MAIVDFKKIFKKRELKSLWTFHYMNSRKYAFAKFSTCQSELLGQFRESGLISWWSNCCWYRYKIHAFWCCLISSVSRKCCKKSIRWKSRNHDMDKSLHMQNARTPLWYMSLFEVKIKCLFTLDQTAYANRPVRAWIYRGPSLYNDSVFYPRFCCKIEYNYYCYYKETWPISKGHFWALFFINHTLSVFDRITSPRRF